jgi:ubiquinone/menaquinone biosynthesis C-methylase UbiE
MCLWNDPQFLRTSQYADSSNLDARIALHLLFSENPQGWFHWLFDQLELPPHGALLEVGCGTGRLWLENLERLPPGLRLYLSDLSPGMLAQAQQLLNSRQPHSAFLAIDAQSIPFPSHCFDVVMANHMLYHVPDRERALADIRRVLKPTGCLYTSTVGESHMVELSMLIEEFDHFLAEQTIPWRLPFSLENGAELLSQFFSHIEMRRYPDALRITQADPLVDYVQSSIRFRPETKKRLEFQAYLKGKLQSSDGVIRITKDSGLFICWNE